MRLGSSPHETAAASRSALRLAAGFTPTQELSEPRRAEPAAAVAEAVGPPRRSAGSSAVTLGVPAPVAQGIERAPPERKVAGSIPAGRITTVRVQRKPAWLRGPSVREMPRKNGRCCPRCCPRPTQQGRLAWHGRDRFAKLKRTVPAASAHFGAFRAMAMSMRVQAPRRGEALKRTRGARACFLSRPLAAPRPPSSTAWACWRVPRRRGEPSVVSEHA